MISALSLDKIKASVQTLICSFSQRQINKFYINVNTLYVTISYSFVATKIEFTVSANKIVCKILFYEISTYFSVIFNCSLLWISFDQELEQHTRYRYMYGMGSWRTHIQIRIWVMLDRDC